MVRPSTEREIASRDPGHERSPDSTALRVSRDTKLESGIPPARERLTRDNLSIEAQERLNHTLSEIARTEANLQSLVRGLKHLTAGANAALESTGPLAGEIDAMRALLARSTESEAALKEQVADLSAALKRAQDAPQRQLRNFIEQEDAFLLELLNDHERQVQELEQRVSQLATQRGGGPDVAELIVQRDQARAYALRCELERDLAWRDLGVQTPAPRVNSSFPAPGEPARAATASVKFRVNTPVAQPPPEPSSLALTPTPPPSEVAAKPVTRRSAEYSMVSGEASAKPTSTQRMPPR